MGRLVLGMTSAWHKGCRRYLVDSLRQWSLQVVADNYMYLVEKP